MIGRRFEPHVLAELLAPEDSRHITSSLLALTRAGLVRPAPAAAGEDRYRFGHGLVRDAAYARIPKSVRASMHETLARRLLEGRTGSPGAEDLAGHHLEQASRALADLGGSDDRARRPRRGRRCCSRAPGGARRPGTTFRRRLHCSSAQTSSSRTPARPEAGSAMHSAAASGRSGRTTVPSRSSTPQSTTRCVPGTCAPSGSARLDRAAFRLVLGTHDELRAVAERAVGTLSSMDDDAALALAWRRMAFADRREGRYGASVAPSARALEHARAAGDWYEETRAIDSLCTGLLYGPSCRRGRGAMPRGARGSDGPAGDPGQRLGIAGRAGGDARPLRRGARGPTPGRVRSTKSSGSGCRSQGSRRSARSSSCSRVIRQPPRPRHTAGWKCSRGPASRGRDRAARR